MSKVTIHDIERVLSTRYCHCEHTFVYGNPQKEIYVHAGVVDKLSDPKYARMWRSHSWEGLMRLICAEDPHYFPRVEQKIEHCKRRWKFTWRNK